MVMRRMVSPESTEHNFAQEAGECAFGQNFFSDAVTGKKIGQIENLHIGEDT